MEFLWFIQGQSKACVRVYTRQGNVKIYKLQHEISNNVVCATSKASDQPVQMHSLIRAFASRLNIL